MKSKVVLSALALLFAAGAMAQDCTFFFPQTKGTQLVKKGYDAKGNLQSVMTYTVDEVKTFRPVWKWKPIMCSKIARGRFMTRVTWKHSARTGSSLWK